MEPWLLYCLIPLVAGLIGWGTNWLAIKMLFRPRKPITFLGLALHGIIPRRKDALARQVAAIIEKELLSTHAVQETIQKINLKPHLESMAKRLIHETLGSKLKNIPFLGNFISGDMLGKVEGMALESMEAEAKILMEGLGADLGEHLHIERMIEEKIQAFDLERLEAMILGVARKEFKTIEWLGGVLGFLVGCIQVLLIIVW